MLCIPLDVRARRYCSRDRLEASTNALDRVITLFEAIEQSQTVIIVPALEPVSYSRRRIPGKRLTLPEKRLPGQGPSKTEGLPDSGRQ